MAEQQTFINLINRYLQQQTYLQENNYLPLKQNESLLKACGDGVILAYYVSWCNGEMCAVKKPKNNFERGDNINNLLKQAKDGGAQFVNIGCADLETSYKLLLAFLTAVTKQGLRRMLAESSREHADLLQKLGIQAENGDDLILKWFKVDNLHTIEDIDCETILRRLREIDCRFLTVKDCQENNFDTVARCCKQMGIEIAFSSDDFEDEEMHYMICATIVERTLDYPEISREFLIECYGEMQDAQQVIVTKRLPMPFFTTQDEVAKDDRVAQYVLLDLALREMPDDSELDNWISERSSATLFSSQWRDVLAAFDFKITDIEEFHSAFETIGVKAPFILTDFENDAALRECLRSLANKRRLVTPALELSKECVLAVTELPDMRLPSVNRYLQEALGEQDDFTLTLQTVGISWYTDEIQQANDELANEAVVEEVMALDKDSILADISAVCELYGCKQDAFAAILGCLPDNIVNSALQRGMVLLSAPKTEFQEWACCLYYVVTSCASGSFYETQIHLASESFEEHISKLPTAVRERFESNSNILRPLVYEHFLKGCAGDFEHDMLGSEASDETQSIAEKLYVIASKTKVSGSLSALDKSLSENQEITNLAAELNITLQASPSLRDSAAKGILTRAIAMLCTWAQQRELESEEESTRLSSMPTNEVIGDDSCLPNEASAEPLDDQTIQFLEQRYCTFIRERECSDLSVKGVCAQFLQCDVSEAAERLSELPGAGIFYDEFESNDEECRFAKLHIMKYAALCRGSTSDAALETEFLGHDGSFVDLLSATEISKQQYQELSDEFRGILCSELYNGYLLSEQDKLLKKISYLLSKGGQRPLKVSKPSYSELLAIKRLDVSTLIAKRAEVGKTVELLHCIRLVSFSDYSEVRYKPVPDLELYANQMLSKLGVSETLSLANIGRDAHLLLNIASRSPISNGEIEFEQVMCALQAQKYDTLLIESPSDHQAIISLVSQVLVPTLARRVKIMDVESRRGYNFPWNEYAAIRMEELCLDIPGGTPCSALDGRCREILADIYFEPEDELDSLHKLPRTQLLRLYDLKCLCYADAVACLRERFSFLRSKISDGAIATALIAPDNLAGSKNAGNSKACGGLKNGETQQTLSDFAENARNNLQDAAYCTAESLHSPRAFHLLLSDLTKQHILRPQSPAHLQWADRVCKFSARVANVQRADEVDFRIIGRLCGVILAQNATIYDVREVRRLLQLLEVPEFYALDQLANKDPFVMRQLLAELYFPYDRLRSQMVYGNSFLRAYVAFRTDDDAITYNSIESITGKTVSLVSKDLELPLAEEDFTPRNEVFLVLYIIDRFLSRETPPPGHFVALLQRRFQIEAFMLRKISAGELARVFAAHFAQFAGEFSASASDSETLSKLVLLCKEEGIFVFRGNDYETAFVINNIISNKRPTDQQFQDKMGPITAELVDRLGGKRLPAHLKRDEILRGVEMQRAMFKDIYYEE